MQGISGVSLMDANLYPSGIKGSQASDNQGTFKSLFQSAMDMVNETNNLSNQAEEEEIKYAMGMSDSVHDLQVAQQKANISLQYTVAVRNTLLDAYREIINMQF